jgi:hypothetical protein
MTQQTQVSTYDLDAIAQAVGIKPQRAMLIISALVDNFGFDATKVPQNGLVSILSTIIGLQQTHNISVGQAVEKYIQNLKDEQKKSGNGKTGYAAGNMAETINNMADDLADKIAPRVIDAAIQKIQSKVIDRLAEGIELPQIKTTFDQLDHILDVNFREVENNERFQLAGTDNALSYFALPEGK